MTHSTAGLTNLSTPVRNSKNGRCKQQPTRPCNLEMLIRQTAPYGQFDSYSLDLQGHEQYNNTANAFPVTLARHHIIPANVLMGFWNQLLNSQQIAAANPLLTLIVKNVGAYGITMDTLDRERVRELSTEIQNGSISHDADQPTPEKWDSFAQVYQWLPGNLFIGPDGPWRADDPGEAFEEGAGVVVKKYRQALQTWQVANDKMKAYIQAPNRVDAQNAVTNLCSIASQFNPAVRPFPLNPDDWQRQKVGGEGTRFSLRT